MTLGRDLCLRFIYLIVGRSRKKGDQNDPRVRIFELLWTCSFSILDI